MDSKVSAAEANALIQKQALTIGTLHAEKMLLEIRAESLQRRVGELEAALASLTPGQAPEGPREALKPPEDVS